MFPTPECFRFTETNLNHPKYVSFKDQIEDNLQQFQHELQFTHTFQSDMSHPLSFAAP